MSLLSTFSTNGINILAGVNGIEVGQSLIIALSVALNDLLYMPLPRIVLPNGAELWHHQGMSLLGVIGGELMVQRHLLSLYFMLPLIGVCSALLYHNWCVPPARPKSFLQQGLTDPPARAHPLQVPLARLCRRHLLLLCRHDVRLRGHHLALPQDATPLLPAANLQLPPQLPAAVRPGALPAPPPPKVRSSAAPAPTVAHETDATGRLPSPPSSDSTPRPAPCSRPRRRSRRPRHPHRRRRRCSRSSCSRSSGSSASSAMRTWIRLRRIARASGARPTSRSSSASSLVTSHSRALPDTLHLCASASCSSISARSGKRCSRRLSWRCRCAPLGRLPVPRPDADPLCATLPPGLRLPARLFRPVRRRPALLRRRPQVARVLHIEMKPSNRVWLRSADAGMVLRASGGSGGLAVADCGQTKRTSRVDALGSEREGGAGRSACRVVDSSPKRLDASGSPSAHRLASAALTARVGSARRTGRRPREGLLMRLRHSSGEGPRTATDST